MPHCSRQGHFQGSLLQGLNPIGRKLRGVLMISGAEAFKPLKWSWLARLRAPVYMPRYAPFFSFSIFKINNIESLH